MKRKTKAPPAAAELESRQDQILNLLDELNSRIERALDELGVTPYDAPPANAQRVAEAA